MRLAAFGGGATKKITFIKKPPQSATKNHLRNGGLAALFPFTLLFSNDLGSKSLSGSNSFNKSPSNFVPTAGVFSNCLGGTGGAKKTY